MTDAPSPRLPPASRLLYAAASLSGNALSRTWGLWLIYFYAPPDDADIVTRIPDAGGLDPRVVLGLVLTAARLIEALDDPLIGHWSDRTRSRWGRRLPFIALGSPWWAICFVLLFTPPVASAAAANVIYLFLVAQLFFLLTNLSGAPLEALLPHLARNNDDRLSIASWQVLFGVGGAALGLSISGLLQAAFGFVWMAAIIAGIAVGVRYTAVAGIWRYALTDDEPSLPGFKRAFTETLSNKQFRAFLPSFVLFQTGLQLLTALLPFYVAAVLADVDVFGWNGADDEGVFTFMLTAMVIIGMLIAVPFFARLARRAGKARAYRLAMVWAAIVFPLLFFAGFVPGIPALAQAMLALFVAGLPTAGVFMFPNILTADIVDYDATRTGTHRQAMFYGAQNMLEKLATAVSPLLFALVLLAGDSAENPAGIRLVGPVAGLLVVLALLSLRGYSLAADVPDAAKPPLA